MEGPRPTGVDVRAVVIMEEPDEVSALQLGPTQSESQEVASTVHREQRNRCRVRSTRRNDPFVGLTFAFFPANLHVSTRSQDAGQ